jgi:phosphate transport system protein
MAREYFDNDLRSLQHNVLQIGSQVEKMIARAVTALVERDRALADQVIADDSQVDVLAYAAENNAIALISMQQPVATDLRRIAAAIVIVQELERMGDHAEGIAKLSRRLGKEPPVPGVDAIPPMADRATAMLRQALRAYVDLDEDLARQVWEMDDEIDILYNKFYRQLLSLMIADQEMIERATSLLHVAHDLERIGDRVTNICERVVYIITGEIAFVRRPLKTAPA